MPRTVLLAGVLLLSACTATETAAPQVASLPGASSAVGTSAAAPPDGERPQLRLDSSDEERDLAWKGYYGCLKQNGHRMMTDGTDHAGPARADGSVDPDAPAMEDNSEASKASKKACEGKLPRQPPELTAETNPHYVDEYRTYITCLNEHQLLVVATDPIGSGWTYQDGVTQPLDETQMTKVDRECTTGTFGKA